MIWPFLACDIFVAYNAANFRLARLLVPDVSFQTITGGELLSALVTRVFKVFWVGNYVLANDVVPEQSFAAERAVAAVAHESRIVGDVDVNGQILFNVDKVEERRVGDENFHVHRVFRFTIVGRDVNWLPRAG
jgi:hypothetical protein